jgi:hypothetical protein
MFTNAICTRGRIESETLSTLWHLETMRSGRGTRGPGWSSTARLASAHAADTVVLGDTLEMTTHGLAVLSWPVVYQPMHDALIEDSLATAEASLGQAPRIQPWSLWVRVLRWVVSRGKARAQVTPNQRLQGMPASGAPEARRSAYGEAAMSTDCRPNAAARRGDA